MSTPVHQKATRRLTLEFDKEGDPVFQTVCSPVSFTQGSLIVAPSRHVIPVIFVPGVMGTNLRSTKVENGKQATAWRPPNGVFDGLGEWWKRVNQEPVSRQKQLNPDTTEVDPNGPVVMPDSAMTLTREEANRRGWGELHWDSYGQVLSELERALNDQYDDCGKPMAKIMDVWAQAKNLKKAKPGQAVQEDDLVTIWNPVKGAATPLTDDEFTRLDDYYYPVWACGYNWLQSNEQSADRLVKKIDEVLDWYKQTNYFIPEGKVIIVTHSMGGLVARRAAQKASDKILGVVHGVQPVGGAPVVYRRFRSGTEAGGLFDIVGAMTAVILGWDAADITCVMANAPGPLELLPTKHYPNNWLRVEKELGNGHRKLLFELPESDPYLEIYSKRVQDVWWGMVDETLIDPAKIHPEKGVAAWENYQDSLLMASNFHDKIKLDCHPNTYAHYGSDAGQISFGSVHWTTKSEIPENLKDGLSTELAEKWTKLGRADIANNNNSVTFKLDNKSKPESDVVPDAGDGTVPMQSGKLINTGAKHVFQMKGFTHAESYKDKNVIENTLYCLGKIIQGAIPAKDLAQTKGETCPDSIEALTDTSSDLVSQPSPVAAS